MLGNSFPGSSIPSKEQAIENQKSSIKMDIVRAVEELSVLRSSLEIGLNAINDQDALAKLAEQVRSLRNQIESSHFDLT